MTKIENQGSGHINAGRATETQILFVYIVLSYCLAFCVFGRSKLCLFNRSDLATERLDIWMSTSKPVASTGTLV
jgi:hypothetical protein